MITSSSRNCILTVERAANTPFVRVTAEFNAGQPARTWDGFNEEELVNIAMLELVSEGRTVLQLSEGEED